MITLGLSQRETDRVLEAMGLKNRARRGETGAAGAGDGGNENPRRIFRVAFYGAVASLITAALVWMGKGAAASTLSGVRAELALHRTVAAHSDELKDHDGRIVKLEAQGVAAARTEYLIKLLEADAEARAKEKKGRAR